MTIVTSVIDLRSLAERYQTVLQEYLAGEGEPALQQAYEIGHQAVGVGLGILDVATVHGEALARIVQQTQTPEESARAVKRATSFFVESVSAFEMIERGYREANTALRRVNETLEQRTVELQEANARLRALTRHIVTTQEEERRRVSRELHDEAGQALVALKLSLQAVRDDLPPTGGGHRQRLEEAVSLTDRTTEQIRLLAHGLRPPALDSAGLNAALEGLCREFARRTQIRVDFTGIDIPILGPATICLYRFLQEALTNAVRHGHATEIQVRLEQDAEHICLSVQDNGQGFDPSSVLSNQLQPKSIGLVGMRERLESISGWLEIDSKPGQGARLIAHVPLEAA
jgi:signal transduction histidine kinase